MSDSSSEPDAHKAKREAAKLLKSAEKSFRRWAKRAGGHLAKAFGEKIRQPSRRELVLQEALARQMEVLHHLSQILIVSTGRDAHLSLAK